ncbi:MAG: hypothetical protein AMXMBFR82_16300 [Candidatus Hydrogenedentota bacterium]
MKRTDAQNGLAWLAAGALVLATCAIITLLSREFVYGESHAERPVLAVLAAYYLGWIGFAAAAFLVYRSQSGSLRWILTVGILGRIILLPSNLVLENDCYRYVLDGETVKHGVNPYRWAPDEVEARAPEAFRRELATDRAQLVLSRVGYPEIPTIYPPLAQGAFAVGAAIAPWNWMGQRIVFLAVDFATQLVLLGLLRAIGRPSGWVVLYAWNPLILKEIANSAHVDALVALFLAVCLFGLLGAVQSRGSASWSALAGAALAAAVLGKLYPAIIAPVCCLYLIAAAPGYTAASSFLAAFFGTFVLGYLPFWGVGLEQLTAGLRIYISEWQRNAGAFALMNAMVPWPRVAAAGIALTTMALASMAAFRARGNFGRLVAAVQWTYLAWFLFLPAAYPWYAIGLIAVSVVRPRLWVVVLSGAFGLYYLHFWIDYHEFPATWHAWTALIEHGAVWTSLAVATCCRAYGRCAELTQNRWADDDR